MTQNEFGKHVPCSWSDVITEGKRRVVKERVIPTAVSFVTGLLSVHQVDGPLRLSSIACGYEGGVVVPQWMRDEGLPDADFVVFLTMRAPARMPP